MNSKSKEEKMKNIKMLLAALIIFSTYSFSNDVEAANKVTIFVNEVEQSYSDKAISENGNTLVPLRGIFEALGAEVTWNNSTSTIDATKGSINIWLEIGSKVTKVNGKAVIIAAPARIVNGSTLVPLRFISEALGAEVLWDGRTMAINIILDDYSPTNPELVPTPTPVETPVQKPIQTNFKNCTELKVVYLNGVAKGHPAYQSKMDRDKDDWACE